MYSLYVKRNNFICNLNPVTKTVIPFSLMLLGIISSYLVVDLIILAVSVLLLVLSRLSAATLRPYLRTIAFLSIVFSINWLFFSTGTGAPIFVIGWLKVTEHALVATLTGITRLLIFILTSILYMGTISTSELIEGLRKLKVPYIVCFILMMAMRFFPTLAADLNMIKEAQMSRGTEFEKGSPILRAKKTVAILIPLLVLSFRRVAVISYGLEARAFTPSLRSLNRTFFKESPMRPRDKVIVTVCIVAFVGMAIYEILRGNFGVGGAGGVV